MIAYEFFRHYGAPFVSVILCSYCLHPISADRLFFSLFAREPHQRLRHEAELINMPRPLRQATALSNLDVNSDDFYVMLAQSTLAGRDLT
jgi:hypothetical protein